MNIGVISISFPVNTFLIWRQIRQDSSLIMNVGLSVIDFQDEINMWTFAMNPINEGNRFPRQIIVGVEYLHL